MPAEFEPVQMPSDQQRLIGFLCEDEWPFHGRRRLAPDDVIAMDVSSGNVASFWIVDGRERIGLVQLLDLTDIGDGAPLLDLRIASRHRGQGFGTGATLWAVQYLFDEYPELHRIEANTRDDNMAMQRVLSSAGFVHEGTLRQAWRSDQGRWFDTEVYGMLRVDRT